MTDARSRREAWSVARAGFWSALVYAGLLVALDVSFAIMAVELRGTPWEGMEVYARTYRGIAFVPQAIGLLAIPALILMLASIHAHATGSRRPWSAAGLAFGSGHAILLGCLYFVQVGIVLPALVRGDWQGLDQYVLANPRSLAWGLDYFAWSVLGIALLFTAFAFHGDGLRRWIRVMLVLNGLANISLIPAFAFQIEALTLGIALVSWAIGLPLTAVLVALDFNHIASMAGNDERATGPS